MVPDLSLLEGPRTRLIVGVTGHRPSRLGGAEHAALAARASEALAAIGRSKPEATLTVLSPVAEGADRIAARAALNTGYELRCVLPFARDMYVRDFSSAASRAEFNALLGLASEVVELDGSRETPESADAAYGLVADWLVAHSDVLLAIWDGAEARGNGGTGDVVRGALAGGLPVAWIAAQPPYAITVLTQEEGVVVEHGGAELTAVVRQFRPV